MRRRRQWCAVDGWWPEQQDWYLRRLGDRLAIDDPIYHELKAYGSIAALSYEKSGHETAIEYQHRHSPAERAARAERRARENERRQRLREEHRIEREREENRRWQQQHVARRNGHQVRRDTMPSQAIDPPPRVPCPERVLREMLQLMPHHAKLLIQCYVVYTEKEMREVFATLAMLDEAAHG